MASVLLYVEGDALRRLRNGRARVPGATWPIDPDAFPQPQLGLLDELSTLFVVTIEGERAVVAAVLDGPEVENHVFRGGDAVEHDHDIGHVLPRLGCANVAELPRWADVPRIVPSDHLDLLRYELQLAALHRAPEPPELFVDDAGARDLRAAVWRDPASDAARTVYADYLLDRGDPRGELIALQLARARSRTPPTDREIVLIGRHGIGCAEPIGEFLAGAFELRRGFVSACIVDDKRAMPEAITRHPAWSTVEAIETANVALLTSGALSAARRVAMRTDFGVVARSTAPVPYEVIVGPSLHKRGDRAMQRGAELREWSGSRIQADAFAQLRVLSVDARAPMATRELIRSELAGRLAQLDFVTPIDAPYFGAWREAFDRSSLKCLSFEFTDTLSSGLVTLMPWIVAIERDRAIVELHEQLPRRTIPALARVVTQVGRGMPRAELRILRGYSYQPLIAELRRAFPEVTLVENAPSSLSP